MFRLLLRRGAQQRILSNLLSPTRLARLVELSATDGAAAYQPTTFLGDVRKGPWSELAAPSVTIDPYRRNLQRAHLELASARITPSADEARALYQGELKALDAEVRAALPKATDAATRRHLDDARVAIAGALDPQRLAPPDGPVARPAGAQGEASPRGSWRCRRWLTSGRVPCSTGGGRAATSPASAATQEAVRQPPGRR